MKRRHIAGALAAAVVLTGSAVVLVSTNSDTAAAANPTASSIATAEVARRTLTRTLEVNGLLGYGPPSALSLNLPGMLTWLPEVGSTIDRGAPVAKVNDQPVVALLGPIPLYRPLGIGARGADVVALKENLTALGYGPPDASDAFTTTTAAAVTAWQGDLGLPLTGVVDSDWVTVLPEPARVVEHSASLGAAAAGQILTTTGTERIVTTNLKVANRDLAVLDSEVTVLLPDGSSTAGTITQVGAPQLPQSESAADADLSEANVPVTIQLKDPTVAADVEVSPIVVAFTAEEHRDVLTVPVNALLALSEGGYGVEVVEGNTTRMVPIRTGMFAAGNVEVTGIAPDALAEGDDVVVPS